ncbi:MAG: DPP IV N-terminal domain-containing protein [Planctomycetota bacterium]|nr:DPP IV N-terminal domain-containing protein [Planctomycetota bacterium]
MTFSRSFARAACLLALPALPAACGTLGLTSSADTPPTTPNATRSGVRVATAPHADHPAPGHVTRPVADAGHGATPSHDTSSHDTSSHDTSSHAAGHGTSGAGAPDEPPSQVSVSRVSFAEEGADFDPSVSKDGTRLFFASTQHRATSDIYAKRVDSRVVTQLTNDPGDDEMPALSPDGEWVAFTSNRAGNWDIYVMPATGGQAMLITGEAEDEIAPSWSPDGSRLVFSRRGAGSGRWEMWAAEVANPTTPVFLGYGLFPKWCPAAGTGADGADRILFQLSRERGRRGFGLWTIDFKEGVATHATEIAGSATRAFINPAWSTDGQWIVFAEIDAPADGQWRRAARPAGASLWMVRADGEGKVRLTSGKGVNLSPSWGASDRLFFVSDRAGSDNIWVMDLAPAIRAAAAGLPPSDRRHAGHAATDAHPAGTTQPPKGDHADNSAVANVDEHGTAAPH